MKKNIFLLCVVMTLLGVKLGQDGENVYIRGDRTGVNVDTLVTPDAALEIDSDDNGLLIPRLTILQRDAILAPANGLMIYNTDCLLFNYFNGIAWIPFPASEELVIGSIAGSETVCEGAIGEAYYISPVTGATSYIWSLPSGATVTSGDGTESIEVDFGSEGDDICVTVTTMCGSSTECLSFTVSEIPVGGVVTGGGTISLGGNTGLLTLSGHTGDVDRWQKRFAAGSWTDIATTATVYSETPISAGIWDYRAVISAAGCSDAFSDYTTVTVEVPEADSIIFSYTGSVQTWTVPTGVTSIEIDMSGAQGGTASGTTIGWGAGTVNTSGGRGGRVETTMTVTPGTTLFINVGGQGSMSAGGFNGGGFYPVSTCGGTEVISAGGGGASDIRQGGTALSNRIIVAGGGGGASASGGESHTGVAYTGAGEGLTGGDGAVSSSSGSPCLYGHGGTQIAGGTGGTNSCWCSGSIVAGSGTSGTGGNPTCVPSGLSTCSCSGTGCVSGGGGGGGYYGGGGGLSYGPGGGGSSYVTPTGTSGTIHTQGYRDGNGQVKISW